MAEKQTTQADSCSLRPMVRLPVMLKLYDADMKEHEYGPIIVEIPEEVASNFDHPGDYIHAVERAALEYLVPDMSCGYIEGLMRSQPNAGTDR